MMRGEKERGKRIFGHETIRAHSQDERSIRRKGGGEGARIHRCSRRHC